MRFVARFNLVVFALMLLLLYRRLSTTTDASFLRLWCLAMMVCSMFLHHVRMFFAEVSTAAATTVGLTYLATGSVTAGALLLCLGVVNSPALLVGLVLVAMWLEWEEKRPVYLLLPLAAAAGIMLEAWIRRGGPFITGYEAEPQLRTVMPYSSMTGFRHPFVLGVLSILLSFGKGLLFFAPGLFLHPAEISASIRRLHRLLLLIVAGLVIVYAKWYGWYGGWFWVPRFFLLAAVPASLTLIACLRERTPSLAKSVTVLCVLLLSTWVGIDGGVFGLDRLARIGMANNYALESLTWYVPEFSPLWYPLIDHRPLALRDAAVIGYALAVAAYLAVPLVMRFARNNRADGLIYAVSGRQRTRLRPRDGRCL